MLKGRLPPEGLRHEDAESALDAVSVGDGEPLPDAAPEIVALAVPEAAAWG